MLFLAEYPYSLRLAGRVDYIRFLVYAERVLTDATNQGSGNDEWQFVAQRFVSGVSPGCFETLKTSRSCCHEINKYDRVQVP